MKNNETTQEKIKKLRELGFIIRPFDSFHYALLKNKSNQTVLINVIKDQDLNKAIEYYTKIKEIDQQ